LDWPVRVTGTDQQGFLFQGTGRLRDISATGAFAHLKTELPVGTQLNISIKLPFENGIWMNYNAQVVRLESDRLETGIALRFEDKKPGFTPQ
jgi:hypothetical protein